MLTYITMKTPQKLMNKMRFIHRNGRAVQVEFRFQPGVWHSTGTQDEYEAVEAAEELYNRLTGITVNKMQTLDWRSTVAPTKFGLKIA
jgi:hypothetical protein